MSHIKLPRALEAYFAFAELPATHEGRRFTITFTYMEAGRLNRLQWWWQVSPGQERADGTGIGAQRQNAIERFRTHIERWLINSRRRLTGGEPFPQLEPWGAHAGHDGRDYVEADRAYTRMTAGR